MLSFQPLINNSVTTVSFSLLIISEIIASKTINRLRFLSWIFCIQQFYQYLANGLLNIITHLFFLIQTLELLIFCMGDLECMTPLDYVTALKMKFSIKLLFSRCDQIGRKLQIWSYLRNNHLRENFIFCPVCYVLFSFATSSKLIF